MQATATLQKTTWSIDPDHSKVEFSITHMLVSQITGYFRNLEGKVITYGNDFTDSKAEIILDAASIDTNNQSRDAHLVSNEFLDAPRFPSISFHSTSIKKVKENVFEAEGELSLHGVTKPVIFQLVYNGKVVDQFGNTRAGIRISGKINRREFGINWNAHLDEGGLVAGETVEIYGNVELLSK